MKRVSKGWWLAQPEGTLVVLGRGDYSTDRALVEKEGTDHYKVWAPLTTPAQLKLNPSTPSTITEQLAQYPVAHVLTEEEARRLRALIKLQPPAIDLIALFEQEQVK